MSDQLDIMIPPFEFLEWSWHETQHCQKTASYQVDFSDKSTPHRPTRHPGQGMAFEYLNVFAAWWVFLSSGESPKECHKLKALSMWTRHFQFRVCVKGKNNLVQVKWNTPHLIHPQGLYCPLKTKQRRFTYIIHKLFNFSVRAQGTITFSK